MMAGTGRVAASAGNQMRAARRIPSGIGIQQCSISRTGLGKEWTTVTQSWQWCVGAIKCIVDRHRRALGQWTSGDPSNTAVRVSTPTAIGCRAMKKVLLVFPTAWDTRQLEYCAPSWKSDFEIIMESPTDEECPSDFDVMGYIDTLAERYRGRVDGVLSTSDYPGATVAGAVAQRLGLPGSAPQTVLRCSHKYYSRLAQAESVPEATPPRRTEPLPIEAWRCDRFEGEQCIYDKISF